MNGFLAFFKKEWTELLRTGRLMILLLLALLLGIMNPAIAKITPWLLEAMSATLESTGLTVTAVTVDASVSWTQFYKNIPMGLLVFVLLFSSILSGEYAKGTLIPILTKGLARFKVIAAKGAVMLLMWTLCYWLCFGITYGYNAYFWDNSIVCNLAFSAACFWLFGIFILSVLLLFSALTNSNTGVLAGTGAVFLLFYVAGMFPTVKEYMPSWLMEAGGLLAGAVQPKEYYSAMWITGLLTLCSIAGSILLFNKKRI